MNALAIIFRLLSLLSVAGLAGFLWFKLDKTRTMDASFLDEVVDGAYFILQSEKEAQWKDISVKKTEFMEIFDANEQIDRDDENPLLEAADSLRASEDAIFRNSDYRESLDLFTLEFGAEALVWYSESKKWKPNPAIKLTPPANFMDPFEDEMKFPKENLKKKDGTLVKAVPRANRLRTVIGMFYKDRHDKYNEISKLRDMIVERDEELREYQNLFSDEKEERNRLEEEKADLTITWRNLSADFNQSKIDRQAEKEALETEVSQYKTRNSQLELDRANDKKSHEAEITAMLDTHKKELEAKREEVRLAEAAGYKKGIEEMLSKQQGGEIAASEISEEVNPFMLKEKGPPKITNDHLVGAVQKSAISESGTPSTIARIDSSSGMVLLPFGEERGVKTGTVFTVWKDKREAARIRVQSSRQGFLLAYILPQFGEPNTLRPGDSIFIIPEKEETL